MAKAIQLTRGAVAIVDDEDFPALAQFKWFLNPSKSKKYAMGHASILGQTKRIYMHRFILSPPDGMLVDHIDGDGLNNRRANLRLVSPRQNCWNVSRSSARSKEMGVYPARHGWIALLTVSGERKYLGYFKHIEDAVSARRSAEVEHFGEYARRV